MKKKHLTDVKVEQEQSAEKILFVENYSYNTKPLNGLVVCRHGPNQYKLILIKSFKFFLLFKMISFRE